MKIPAISTPERALIIHQLDQSGKWEGESRGAQISFARINGHVHYSVSIGINITGGWKENIEEAVDACNSIIRDRPPEPMVGRARDPNHTGTRLLVRQRNNRALEAGRLFEEA